jgi:hypothetical protein
MKTCTHCKQEKEDSAFRANNQLKSGLHSWCKECEKHGKRSRADDGTAFDDRDFVVKSEATKRGTRRVLFGDRYPITHTRRPEREGTGTSTLLFSPTY